MDKEDYVSLEVAKLLKEKGYPQEYNVGTICRLQNKANPCYKKTREITQSDIDNAWCVFNEIYPTLYEAAKWLRLTHRIYVYPSVYLSKDDDESARYLVEAYIYNKDCWESFPLNTGKYEIYEEALNDGIYEALKLI